MVEQRALKTLFPTMLYACAAGVGAYVPGGPQPGASAPRPPLPSGIVGGGADPFTGANARPASTSAPAGALTVPKPALSPPTHISYLQCKSLLPRGPPRRRYRPVHGRQHAAFSSPAPASAPLSKTFSLHHVTEQQGALRVAQFPSGLARGRADNIMGASKCRSRKSGGKGLCGEEEQCNDHLYLPGNCCLGIPMPHNTP